MEKLEQLRFYLDLPARSQKDIPVAPEWALNSLPFVELESPILQIEGCDGFLGIILKDSQCIYACDSVPLLVWKGDLRGSFDKPQYQ